MFSETMPAPTTSTLTSIPHNATQPLPDFLIFNTPRSIFQFLLSGYPSSSLANVTHLRIQFPSLTFDSTSQLHESYLIATRILLRILPNLRDLVLLWTGVPARVFDGVSFHLEALTCTMKMDEFEGLKFLTMQSGLQLVELPYWRPPRTISPTSSRLHRPSPNSNSNAPFFPREALLPDLSEVSLPPLGLMQLVPGRPVHSVDVRLVGRHSRRSRASRTVIKQRLSEFGYEDAMDLDWDTPSRREPQTHMTSDEDDDEEIVTQLEPHEWPIVMHSLSQSASNVDDLALATLDGFNPDVHLRAIATHLPYVRSLYIRAYTPEDTTQDLFQWANWAPYLGHLPYLESLKVEFDCRYLPNPSTPPPSKMIIEETPRPMVRFSIPTSRCLDLWAYECCPELGSVYIGVFGGDALVDWARDE